MGASITEVDVRDMLCAQALAVVAQAMKPLKAGDCVDVQMSTEDVRSDLLAWAQAAGFRVQPVESLRLRIGRGRMSGGAGGA